MYLSVTCQSTVARARIWNGEKGGQSVFSIFVIVVINDWIINVVVWTIAHKLDCGVDAVVI